MVAEIEVKQHIEDPTELIIEFRKSEEYRAAFEKFFEGKSLVDVTEEDKRLAFENNDMARIALIDFERRDGRFQYNSDHYSPETRAAIEEYLTINSDFKKMTRAGDAIEIADSDKVRSMKHTQAAVIMSEYMKDRGVPISRLLGRGLVSLIAINLGYDNYARIQLPYAAQIKRVLGATK